MVKNRHLFPLVAGIVLLVLAGYTGLRRSTTVVANSQSVLQGGGNPLTFSNLDLKTDLHYRLAFGSLRKIPDKASSVISASLTDESGSIVFELDDSYWRDTGTWHEGGESGSWDETNAVTSFDFRVPSDGKYDIEVSLESSTQGSLPIGAQLLSSSPAPFREWPLLVGAGLLFLLAGWIWFKRGDKMAEWISTLGTGSRLTMDGEEWTVSRWATYVCEGETSVELTLTAPNGMVRYLSSARWEKTWEDSEGNDHTRHYRQILLGNPVGSNEITSHDGQDVSYRGAWFDYDADNSGVEHYTEYRGLGVAKAIYRSQIYRPSLFPRNPGELWVEHSRDQKTGEEEWTVLKIVDWKDISIIEEKQQVIPERNT